jgi:hypothetical protein
MNDYQVKLLDVLLDYVGGIDISDGVIDCSYSWDGQDNDEWQFKDADKTYGYENLSNAELNRHLVNYLNEQGIKTERGLEWNLQRWRECRYSMAKDKDGNEIDNRRDLATMLDDIGLLEKSDLFGSDEDSLGFVKMDYNVLRQGKKDVYKLEKKDWVKRNDLDTKKYMGQRFEDILDKAQAK